MSVFYFPSQRTSKSADWTESELIFAARFDVKAILGSSLNLTKGHSSQSRTLAVNLLVERDSLIG
jgi:hypothetical protein